MGDENIKKEQLRYVENERMEMKKNERQVRAATVTPDQAAADEQTSPEELAMGAERAKTKRAFLEAMETPEEYAIRRLKATERERKRRLRLAKERLDKPLEGEEKIKKEMELKKRRDKFRASIEKESPEQAAARRAKRNEYMQRKKKQRCPEDIARAAEKSRARRALRNANETPEENAIRRAKATESERKRRLLASERKLGEVFQAQEKLKKEMELKKRREKLRAKKEKETPEQAVARRAKANAREKRRQQMQSTEKEAARRAKKAEYERNRYRQKQLLQDRLTGDQRTKRKKKWDTDTQTTERPPKNVEIQKEGTREHIFFQNVTEEMSKETCVVNSDANEFYSWSSFGPSEGSRSITAKDELLSNQNVSEGTIIVKNEPSDGSLSNIEGSNLSFLIQEVFEDNENFPSIKGESIDVEYKPSTSLQGLEENNMKTDKDIEFRTGCMAGSKIKSEFNYLIEPVVQEIIIKEEVDL